MARRAAQCECDNAKGKQRDARAGLLCVCVDSLELAMGLGLP
jgi:hypothetical protein